MKYKISIIIPCYNQEKYLDKCLDSVFRQTYANWECILINDGSTDRTVEILENWSQKDNRFKIFTQKNSGVSAARNAGIEKASGEYVFFLDSDDYFYSDDNLAKFAEEMNSEVDIISANYCYDMGGGNLVEEKRGQITKREEFAGDEVVAAYFNHKVTGITCNKMFSRKLIVSNNLCFNTKMAYSEDMILLLELLTLGNKMINIPQLTYCYYRANETSATTTSSSTNAEKYISSQLISIEKILELIENKKRWKSISNENLLKYITHQYGFLKSETLLQNRRIWIATYNRIRKLYRENRLNQIQEKFRYPACLTYPAAKIISEKKMSIPLRNIAAKFITY